MTLEQRAEKHAKVRFRSFNRHGEKTYTADNLQDLMNRRIRMESYMQGFKDCEQMFLERAKALEESNDRVIP